MGDKTANDFFIPRGEVLHHRRSALSLYETNLRKFAERNQHHIDNGRLNLMLWCCEKNSYHLKGIFVDEGALLTGNNPIPEPMLI